jgi:hypothetical protein
MLMPGDQMLGGAFLLLEYPNAFALPHVELSRTADNTVWKDNLHDI